VTARPAPSVIVDLSPRETPGVNVRNDLTGREGARNAGMMSLRRRVWHPPRRRVLQGTRADGQPRAGTGRAGARGRRAGAWGM